MTQPATESAGVAAERFGRALMLQPCCGAVRPARCALQAAICAHLDPIGATCLRWCVLNFGAKNANENMAASRGEQMQAAVDFAVNAKSIFINPSQSFFLGLVDFDETATKHKNTSPRRQTQQMKITAQTQRMQASLDFLSGHRAATATPKPHSHLRHIRATHPQSLAAE